MKDPNVKIHYRNLCNQVIWQKKWWQKFAIMFLPMFPLRFAVLRVDDRKGFIW